ncbi:phospholipase D-like domain-containing protein [Stieleria sp. TO1_6]|uniref:phospholipase D-like domain-containing protein n=1 Tax=Stieleria tagensis TaxID=2956795 RepID=UPI00209ADDEE|nr:phospholipase D-like domain-containing protein [Stieleria tagensis]MCO8123152.1 phospholipase D-like domain-containing protein [Stieleria tagensis]
MFYLYLYLAMLVGALTTLIAMTAMRQSERHSVGKFGWLLLILLSPPIGLVLFLFLGGRKISAEHENREIVQLPTHASIAGGESHPLAEIAVTRGLVAPSDHNRLRVLLDPESMWKALFEVVESAERRIYVHSFILIDDRVGQRLIDVLCAKAKSGVEVRLMIDGFGSFTFPNGLLESLEQAGGYCTRFKPLSRIAKFAYLNYRNHRKLMVVDGQQAILGGANFVEYEMTPTPDNETWVDFLLQVDGQAAQQIEAVFLSDWDFATEQESRPPLSKLTTSVSEAQGNELASEDRTMMQVIPVGPDGPDEILDDLWLAAINRANDRIWIVTPYFVPPPTAMRSLEIAARRGVDVRVIVPESSDMPPADVARGDYLHDLTESGGKALCYPDRMVHSKMLLVDDQVAYIGSANFDMRSFFLNYELVLAVFDQTKIDELATWYDKLSDQCIDDPVEKNWRRRLLGITARVFAEEM